MEQTEELDILKEHTEELLAPLSDTSGTGHPQRHQNVQTEAWLVLELLHVPISQLFHLIFHLSAHRALLQILPDTERCLGDGTLGDQCLGSVSQKGLCLVSLTPA